MTSVGRPADRLGARTLGGAGRMGFATAVEFGVQIVATMTLARLMDPSQFGLVAAAGVVVVFARLLADLSLAAALVQREDIDDSHVRVAFTVNLGMGTGLAAGLWFAAPLLSQLVLRDGSATEALRILAATFVLGGASSTAQALLAREFRFGDIARVEAVSSILCSGLLAVVLAFEGWGWRALVFAAVARAVMSSLWMVWLRPHAARPSLALRPLRDLFRTGFGLSLARIVNYFATEGDTLLVGRFLGATELGLYERAFRIATIPSAIYHRAAAQVAASSMSRVQSDLSRLRAAFRRGMALTGLVGLPLAAAMAILAPEIVAILLGSGWERAVPVFQILSYAAFLRLAYRVSQTVLIARGRVYAYAAIQVVYAAAVFGGVFVAAPYGLDAVAWAVNGAIAANFVLLTTVVMRDIGAGPGVLLGAIAPGLLHAVMTVVVIVGATALLRDALPPAIVGACAAGLAACALLMLYLPSKASLVGADGVWLRQQIVSLATSRLKKSGDAARPVRGGQ